MPIRQQLPFWTSRSGLDSIKYFTTAIEENVHREAGTHLSLALETKQIITERSGEQPCERDQFAKFRKEMEKGEPLCRFAPVFDLVLPEEASRTELRFRLLGRFTSLPLQTPHVERRVRSENCRRQSPTQQFAITLRPMTGN